MKLPNLLKTFKTPHAAVSGNFVAIDLGSKATKAVHIEKNGDDFVLRGYVVVDTPYFEDKKGGLAEHLEKVTTRLGGKGDKVILVIDDKDSLVRNLEMPAASAKDLRSMLRLNATALIQHQLSDYAVDCHPLENSPASDRVQGKDRSRSRVLIGGARTELIGQMKSAAREAGLELAQITLNRVGPMNAFKMAMPEVFQNEVIALVDIGHAKSGITVFSNGSLVLHREVKSGGDTFTKCLAEAMKIVPPVAEGLKLIMPEKVRSELEPSLAAFGQEIRASLEFVEYQHDQRVSRVFFSGASARSDFFLQAIQQEIGVPCRKWDSTRFMQKALPVAEIESVKDDAPALVTAVGAAMALCGTQVVHMNLLAEEQQNKEIRRDNPARRSLCLAGAMAIVLLMAGALEAYRLHKLEEQTAEAEITWSKVEARLPEAQAQHRLLEEAQAQLVSLRDFSAQRVLWGSALNALQLSAGNRIQLTHLQAEQRVVSGPGLRNGNAREFSSPAYRERTVLLIQGRNLDDSAALENYVHDLGVQPYFQENLSRSTPIRLRDNAAGGIDPGLNLRTGQDLGRGSTFALECIFSERPL